MKITNIQKLLNELKGIMLRTEKREAFLDRWLGHAERINDAHSLQDSHGLTEVSIEMRNYIFSKRDQFTEEQTKDDVRMIEIKEALKHITFDDEMNQAA